MKKTFLIIFAFSLILIFSGCGTNKAPVKAEVTVQLTREVVAEHNSSTDCWLTVNNNIYNITNYVAWGSGGDQAIASYCGRDATAAFNAEDKNSSSTNLGLDRPTLEQYYIGSLAE